MARGKRTDENQQTIINTFLQCHWCVKDCSAVGEGFTDLVVQGRRFKREYKETLLVEVKDGNKPPSKRKLTPAQVIFHKLWECHIVESQEDVFKLIGINL